MFYPLKFRMNDKVNRDDDDDKELARVDGHTVYLLARSIPCASLSRNSLNVEQHTVLFLSLSLLPYVNTVFHIDCLERREKKPNSNE